MNKNNLIGIDHKPGSFTDRWIFFLKKFGVSYEIINPMENDFFKKIEKFKGIMFHLDHHDYFDYIYKKDLIYQIDNFSNCEVFPKYKDVFFFNNKILQKNFFEKNNLQTPETFISFSKKESLKWINETNFPKVFKLKCGASGNNVFFVKNKKEAKKIINKAFSNGFNNLNYSSVIKDLKQNTKKSFLEKKILTFLYILNSIGLIKNRINSLFPKEKNYVIFQKFINSKFDLRIIKIGGKIICVKRLVRENDFRASGSNIKIYHKEEIDIEVIKIAKNISQKLNTECMAYDFVEENKKYYILEMSNGFVTGNFYENCEGFYDEDFKFHSENIFPEKMMLETFLKRANVDIISFDEKF